MASRGTVIQFATGRPAVRPQAGPRSVAAIAEALARDADIKGEPSGPAPVLPVRLDSLCGVDDRTIARLAAVAATGMLTSESAARLALRHAEEIGRHAKRLPPSARGREAAYRITVSGDLFGDHAIRIAGPNGGPRIFAARPASLDRLLSAFPVRGSAICLLVSADDEGCPAVRVISQASWPKSLIRRANRPDWNDVRHILVLGGLPLDHFDRTAVLVGIKEAVRRAKIHRSGAKCCSPPAQLSKAVRPLLPLIELALKGVVAPL